MHVDESRNDEWMTPDWIIHSLPKIDLDPCSHPQSHVVASNTYDIRNGQDGLELPWHGTVFCNPPYSRTGKWLKKCRMHDGTTIALVPANPGDGPWMKEVWPYATAIGFIQNRVEFRDPRNDKHSKRGRGHALVVWGPMPQFTKHDRIRWVLLKD